MTKKKQQTEQVLKFDTIRPFGPTIMRGRMPDFITKMLDDKATEMLTDKKLSKEFDHSGNLAGNVKQEVRFPQDWMNTEEFLPMVQLIGEMVKNYISIPPASETIKPEFVGKMVIESMWSVSQYAGDFNPFHIHGVYPFRTPNEERRSVSFNLHLIKKDDTVIVDDNKDK